MVDVFDPYHKWLGIPADDQPPHHYRLLAVRLFESDADVIEAAAEQRMAHVRVYQTGIHSTDSQRILNELAAARLCLLMPEKREAYDQALRLKLSSTARMPMQPPPLPIRAAVAIPVAPPTEDETGIVLDFMRPNEAQLMLTQRRHGKRSLAMTLVGVSSILLGLMSVAFFVRIAQTRQYFVAETADDTAEALAQEPKPAASEKPDNNLPPFPTITPHEVTIPDPRENPMNGFRDWLNQMKADRDNRRATTPAPFALPKPQPPASPPTNPNSQTASLPSEVTTEPRDPNRPLSEWVTEAVKRRDLERTLAGGGSVGGTLFADVPSAGTLLVGFQLTVADGQTVTSIMPSFVSPRGGSGLQGTRWGTERGRPVSVVARRGFAVGAIHIQGETAVDGFEVQFMRITRTGLDPDDSYNSPWIGLRTSQPVLTLGGDGLPVVGVFGRAGAAVISLGLVQLPAE